MKTNVFLWVQQQRQQRNNVQGSANPSMVSLHHAVPIEIRSSSSTSSASSSIKSGASNKNGKILINTRGHSSSIPAGQQNLPKGVPSYFVTDPDDEDDETQVSAV